MQSKTKSFLVNTGQVLLEPILEDEDYQIAISTLILQGFSGASVRVYSENGSVDFHPDGPKIQIIQHPYPDYKKAPPQEKILVDVVGGSGGKIMADYFLIRRDAGGRTWDTRLDDQLNTGQELMTANGETLVDNTGDPLATN